MHTAEPGTNGPLQLALPPSAQRVKSTQHPGPVQSQSALLSTKTEWQSVRASHESWSVTLAHGTGGHGGPSVGQANPVPGSPQPTNARSWHQLQYSAWQSPRALHVISSRPLHGAGVTGHAYSGQGATSLGPRQTNVAALPQGAQYPT
jgi:hypothetical protein